MEEKEKYIKEALEKDVDLSAEEYREKCLKADNSTATHGVEGKAPVSEAIRHKRIQSNFYGTSLNVMLSVLSEISFTNELLSDIRLMIYAGMSDEAKERYANMITPKENHHGGK